MKWHEAVAKVKPYIVKVETPGGHGTGFLCLYNENKTFCGIATAYHVVREADYWQQPIRISHVQSEEPAFITEAERVIYADPRNDSAVILFPPRELNLPVDLLELIPLKAAVKLGVEVGWLGYPSVAPSTLCFFSGNISARRGAAYFIDGVAINGVSGGPVFHTFDQHLRIIGTISAYFPNIASGETLPGLSFAQGVTSFHDTISRIRSIDEAREQQKEQEQQAVPMPPEASDSDGQENESEDRADEHDKGADRQEVPRAT
jgi:hypothetical protein